MPAVALVVLKVKIDNVIIYYCPFQGDTHVMILVLLVAFEPRYEKTGFLHM